jgi:ribonuclease HI
MIVESQKKPSPSRQAGLTQPWTVPSIVSQIINSLSSTKADGVAGRFAKIIALLSFLLLSHQIICIKDIRIPTNNFLSTLQHIFPNYTFNATAHDNYSAGVVTIYPKSMEDDYEIKNTILAPGYILSTTFHHLQSSKELTVINAYLHASSNDTWKNQVGILHRQKHKKNTIIIGDFNHAPDVQDRSGYHQDKPKGCVDNFRKFLEENHFEEIYQKKHTWYGTNEGRLTSSRIDHAYHNMDACTLSLCNPKATVISVAPYTVSRDQPIHSGSDWHTRERHDDLMDRQLVKNLKKAADGGNQVTDHLPLSLRFSKPNTSTRRKFVSRATSNNNFKSTFKEIWEGSLTGDHWSDDLLSMGETLCTTSHLVKNKINEKNNKNTELWEAVRLVSAIDEGKTDIHEKFKHIPDYLSLAQNCDKLVEKINSDFAVIAYDNDNKVPISKLQTIAKTLPNSRTKLSQLYDASTERITNDPDRMTAIAANFWKDKWNGKGTYDAKPLFDLYGKKIAVQPIPITLDLIIDIINNTEDSAPGPDGIPFAAYRAVVDIAAPIFLEAIKALMDGATPHHSFNAGILHLLPKKVTDRIEDTRPLVINNTDNRIIAAIIQASILPSIESILSDKQNGFRSHRSTFNNIDYLNEKFYNALENGEFCDILFVDFLKAFDSISHTAIFSLLDSIGLPSNYTSAIKSLFHQAHCYTNFTGGKPEKIFFNSGVKQGCPLSPTLFILVVDVLLDMLSNIEGVDPRMFADDTSLISNNIIPCLPEIKACFATFKKYTGLELNVTKSAIIATGGRTDLRKALDDIGWAELRISGKERYLGTYMGHAVTLEDIFRPPFEKLQDRISQFNKIKHTHSLQNRVIIWNTWLLTIFNYVFNLYAIPTDYLDWVDNLCIGWLNKGNTMKTLYLARPTKLAGLTTPLRDTTIANYAALASRAGDTVADTRSSTQTLRSSNHRARARDFLQVEYNIDSAKCANSASYYHYAINSTPFTSNFRCEIRRKLTEIMVPDHLHNNYFNNSSKAPSWLPSYVRGTVIFIVHNALFTARRLHKCETCYLCEEGSDDIHHIWGSCRVVKQAHQQFWKILGVNSPYSLNTAICADDTRDSASVGAQYMLTDSIWRARNNAYHGVVKNFGAWTGWIVENALLRIKTSRPDFFINNFSTNTVPRRMKITFGACMGSSKTNSDATRATANHVVYTTIRALPVGALYAFTDGSADPNPGPSGAGAAIYLRGTTEDSLIASFSAALGHGTNNTGELFAIGIVYSYINSINYHNIFTIFTDSNLARGALEEGWSAGVNNRPLLHAVRAARRKLKQNNCINWIPGHSGIAHNDL